jgi:hypothetical protein
LCAPNAGGRIGDKSVSGQLATQRLVHQPLYLLDHAHVPSTMINIALHTNHLISKTPQISSASGRKVPGRNAGAHQENL